jgi:two-component system sensor histidine kinase YesM
MLTTNESSMEMAQTYMQEKITDYDELLYSVLFDEQFINSISQSDDESVEFALKRYMEDRLRNLFNSNPNHIEQIQTYTRWDDRLVTLTNHQVLVSNDHPEWESQEYEGEFLLEANDDYFTLKRYINDFDTRERLGGIAMSIKWHEMKSAFEMLNNKHDTNIFIVDGLGNVIHNPNSDRNSSQEVIESMKEEEITYTEPFIELNDYYVFTEFIHQDLYITKFISKDSVFSSGHSIIKVGILIGVIAIAILLVFSLFFYWKVTRPIKQLAYEMEKVIADNFHTSIKVDHQRTDEIRILQEKYVEMMKKIRELIETEYMHELEKKNAQFQALQHKINPHFLHNSLQLIGNTALSNDGTKVYEMIGSLGEIFRYTLRANKDIATIHEEINYLKEYLYIQQQRFGQQLEIDIYVDEEIKQATIPILTLQPIVENAFSHGFVSDQKEWNIHMSVEKVMDEVEIRIRDNGIGIDSHIIHQLNRIFEEEPKDLSYVRKSIGLQNVNNRLKIIYGREYGIKIYSDQHMGTEIFIRIPLIIDKGELEQ